MKLIPAYTVYNFCVFWKSFKFSRFSVFRIRKQLVFPELFQLRFIAWRLIFLASNKAYIKKKRQVLSLAIFPFFLEFLQFRFCTNFLAAFTHYYNTGSQI